MRYTPRPSGPTHSAFWRSMNSVTTVNVLPSNPGTTKGFHTPCESCCSPKPRPEAHIPTQSEASGLGARAHTPGSTFDFGTLRLYVWNDPGLQRVRLVLPPSQRFPAESCANEEYGS